MRYASGFAKERTEIRRDLLEGAAAVVDLSRAVRNIYVFHRRAAEERATGEPAWIGKRLVPSWDGGVDRHGRNLKPVWPRLAELIGSRQFDPLAYVESRFADASDGRIPEPNMLLSENAVVMYERYWDQAPRNAESALTAEKAQFMVEVPRARRFLGLDDDGAARATLADPSTDLSPLFRRGMAAAGGDPGVAAEFRNSAVLQLTLRFHALSVGWGEFIPADDRRDAERVRSILLGSRIARDEPT